MLTIFAMTAALATAAQNGGEWQDFGAGPDGVRVRVNLDSIAPGTQGPEAMVRLSHARPAAGQAAQSDYRSIFDCSARTVARLRMVDLDANGAVTWRDENGQQATPLNAPAGTPLGQVLDLVCETAAG